MSASDYLENELLDHIFGQGTRDYVSPTIYVGLSTADPLDDASGLAEPVGNAYARVATVAADWGVASGGSVTNANAITFPKATGSWGTITHFALFDALTGGNMLISGTVTPSQSITTDNTPSFPASSLTTSLD